MPKRKGITHEARAKLMTELNQYQLLHPEGCTTTRLARNLGWSNDEAQKTVDDLAESGMVYGDYVSEWAKSHLKSAVLGKGGGYLLKVSPWGKEFLEHWDELGKLSVSRNHHYSEADF